MRDVLELLKKVRRVEIVANRTVNDLFAGQYRSVFRGRGIEFNEVREYAPGDDIRSIDWNVTARTGVPYIKRYVEERELTVLFLVDTSASGLFGGDRSKVDTAIELTATLMFSAMKNNDKVGLLTFGDRVEQYFQPRKGRANVLHLLRELLACEPRSKSTNLRAALEYLNRIQRRRAVVFLISDFFIPDLAKFRDGRDWDGDRENYGARMLFPDELIRMRENGAATSMPERQGTGFARSVSIANPIDSLFLFGRFHNLSGTRLSKTILTPTQKALLIASRRHDVVALMVRDRHETEFPDVGLLTLRDAETGETAVLDTSRAAVRDQAVRYFERLRENVVASGRHARIDLIQIETGGDYVKDLRAFFDRRTGGF